MAHHTGDMTCPHSHQRCVCPFHLILKLLWTLPDKTLKNSNSCYTMCDCLRPFISHYMVAIYKIIFTFKVLVSLPLEDVNRHFCPKFLAPLYKNCDRSIMKFAMIVYVNITYILMAAVSLPYNILYLVAIFVKGICATMVLFVLHIWLWDVTW